MKTASVKNADIAAALDRIADLLEVQDANRYRVAAYRRAAKQVTLQASEVADSGLDEDCSQLEALPDIGTGMKRMAKHPENFNKARIFSRL